MVEYIERSAVLAKRTIMIEYDEGGWDARVEVVLVEDIDAIPAADVAPVVHRRWIENCVAGFSKAFATVFVCSECEKRYRVPGMNYCPNCGAKMDAEGGED